MTATQIIEEIKRLDPEQQLGVIRFAYQLDAERKLTGDLPPLGFGMAGELENRSPFKNLEP